MEPDTHLVALDWLFVTISRVQQKQPLVKVGGPDNLGPHILKSYEGRDP